MAVFLVTGGAGFIGSHLAGAMLEEGQEVRLLDRVPPVRPADARLHTLVADLKDLDAARDAARGVDTVFHLAMPSEWHDPQTRALTEHAAAAATMHVLIAARECGVRRVVYASCGSVYGLAAVQRVHEDTPLAPASELARAKETGEKDCYAFNYLYGLETVRLRFFNVYGPGLPQAGPYARFLSGALPAMLAGRSPNIPGDGRSPLDLLFVKDAVYALLQASRTPRAAGKVYNIGYGQPTSPLRIVDLVNRILARDIQPTFSGAAPKDEFSNLPDVGRAEIDLGFCPAFNLERGLRETIDYYLAQPAPSVDLGAPAAPPPGRVEEKTPNA